VTTDSNAEHKGNVNALARETRRHVLLMTHKAQSSHVGSALSIVDILAVLYGGVLNVRAEDPHWPDRDRLIVSKGHACSAVYAVLALRGFFPMEWLDGFYGDAQPLAGHVIHSGVPGIEVSTGALGHGLAIGCGMALAAKRDGANHRVFVLLSDGECDEGSVWEAALFAGHHQLDNLVVIVDFNKIQSLGDVADVLGLEPFAAKWRAFKWATSELDGHDIEQLTTALTLIPLDSPQPTCVIAHTVKGKGVSFMERQLLWHYRSPNEAELADALAEVEAAS
jgi:transketolase